MRIAQYRVYSRILSRINVPDYIYAFERNKSIPVMAALHVGKAIVISIDIKDFFHSIKQSQLEQLFKQYGIGDKPARTLSELCTYKAFVPQGAITSPKVSNIIAAKTFGPQVKAYCDGKGLTLTIYADDITVSSQDPNLNAGDVITALTNIIHENGFRVNTRKTKVMRKYHRQYVCGVVVNEKTNLVRKERLRLRAIVHNIKVNGPSHEAQKNNTTVDHFIDVLRGRLNWFKQLNKEKGEDLILKLKAALDLHKVEVPEKILTTEATTLIDGDQVVSNDGPLPWEDAIATESQTPQPGV
jgi:RNA-directed DNA polymerase